MFRRARDQAEAQDLAQKKDDGNHGESRREQVKNAGPASGQDKSEQQKNKKEEERDINPKYRDERRGLKDPSTDYDIIP